jgi:hypothetical protein
VALLERVLAQPLPLAGASDHKQDWWQIYVASLLCMATMLSLGKLQLRVMNCNLVQLQPSGHGSALVRVAGVTLALECANFPRSSCLEASQSCD